MKDQTLDLMNLDHCIGWLECGGGLVNVGLPIAAMKLLKDARGALQRIAGPCPAPNDGVSCGNCPACIARDAIDPSRYERVLGKAAS